MKKIIITISCLVFITLQCDFAFAWARHNLINQICLKEAAWLADNDTIRVKPCKDSDEEINPQFIVHYHNPIIEQHNAAPINFYYYKKNANLKNGFRGAEPDQKTTALEILSDFSDEPDWDMDKNINVPVISRYFMGGSYDYLHKYYPAFTSHLPIPFLPLGGAPQRAVYFYKKAGFAFKNGDTYWGFRNLARSLHYVQDLSEPFNSSQSGLFFKASSPIKGSAQIAQNYQFAYESLIAHILEQEHRGTVSAGYHQILEDTPAFNANSIEELAKETASKSCDLSSKIFKISKEIFGDKLLLPEPVEITEKDINTILKSPLRKDFDELAWENLRLLAQSSKAFMNLAHKDFFGEN